MLRAKKQKRSFLPSITISGTGCLLRNGNPGQNSGSARVSLLIGLSFLAIALIASQLVAALNSHLLAQLLSYSLLILGWVAMWQPITVFLYELSPIIRLKKIYEKISRMEIEILPLPQPG